MNQAALEFSEQSYPEQSFPWPSSSGSSRFPYNSTADKALDNSSSSETDSDDDELPAYRYRPDNLDQASPSLSLSLPRPPLPLPLLLRQRHHRRLNHSMVDLGEQGSSKTLTSHQTLTSGHRRSLSATTEKSPFHDINHTKRFSRFISPPRSPIRAEHHIDEQHREENANEYYESEMVGQEPGVDVQTMNVELPDCVGSQITIIDYSFKDCKIAHYDVEKDGKGVITGSNEQNMVQKNLTDALEGRPEWCKVRWIVVNGLSWEAIKPITLHYKLHPLAVEDMLDIPQRTKMEVFEEQLFCCYPLHVLSTTETPYSIAHMCIRQSLLSLCWVFDKIRWCFTALKALIISFSQYFKEGLWNTSSNDVENNPRFGGVSAFSEEGVTDRNIRSSLSASSPSVSIRSLSSSTLSGTSSNMDRSCCKRGSGYDKKTVKSPERVCNSDLKDGKCMPFYTINCGILYGNASASFVAEKLRQMQPRSIYDWNQGNYVLKKEALRNMHIPNTPYSYEITLEQVSLFMVGDTVITFFEKSGPEIYVPLENRLKSHDTMLRQSSDPAILVQAILDASVDLLGPILNAYRTRLSRLQVQSIQQPNLQHTRALHAFMTDLSILRPPISSIASLVNGLWSKCSISRKHTRVRERKERRQQQSQATNGHSPQGSLDAESKRSRKHSGNNASKGSSAATSKNGLNKSAISEIASLYFGDVTDHALRYLQDLDDMRNQSMTLSSLIFNTISIHGSDYMKMLSLVSVVFLPLTFLTGYFGMNFKTFAMLNHDVAYYWVVAAPAAAALSAIVMYSSTKYQLLEIWSRGKAQL